MKKEIVESILFPSHIVPGNYVTHTVITVRGRKLSGYLVQAELSDEKMLVQLDGQVINLKSEDIDQILPEKVSVMPEGLLDELELQEIADLFAYLCGPSEPRMAESPDATVTR
jgi:putative heme-binding domain-containing protein